MSKKIFSLLSLFCLVAFLIVSPSVLAADAYLALSPASGSFGSSFELEVRVNTGGQAVGGVDVYLQFPSQLLKLTSVQKTGGVFSELSSLILNEQGQARLTAYFPAEEAAKSYTGSDGLIATLTFSPLASGTASVSFICTAGATNDSNIVAKTTNQEIINCSSNRNGSYQLTAGVGGTTNPTPTPTVPVSGSLVETLSLSALGLLALLAGLFFAF